MASPPEFAGEIKDSKPSSDFVATAINLLDYLETFFVSSYDYETQPLAPQTSEVFIQIVPCLLRANMTEKLNALVCRFEWLLVRSSMNDPLALVEDLEAASRIEGSTLTTQLVACALRLSLSALYVDWKFLPAQLVGRLIGHEKTDDGVANLLANVRKWRGPKDGRGWWCPVQPTLEAAGGSLLLSFIQTAKVRAVVWSPDGKLLCVGCQDYNLSIWEVASNKCILVFNHPRAVTSVVWSSNGLKVYSGCDDRVVREWDRVSGKCLKEFRGHNKEVTSVAWNSRFVASGSKDNTVRVWELAEGKCVNVFSGHTEKVTCVAWSASGLLCSGSWDRTARIWDIKKGTCMKTFIYYQKIQALAWSENENYVCTANADKIVCVWECSTERCIKLFKSHANDASSVTWITNDRVCSGGYDKIVRIWDFSNNREQIDTCLQILLGHTDKVCSVSWNAAEQKLCSGGRNKTIYVWDLNKKCISPFAGHSHKVISMAWSPDGRLCTGSKDRSARVWDLLSGEIVGKYIGHLGPVTSVSWGEDGKLASRSVDKHIPYLRVWDVGNAHPRVYKGPEAEFTGQPYAVGGELPQSLSFALSIAPQMRIWVSPLSSHLAVAQCGPDHVTVHPVHLLGEVSVRLQISQK